MPGKVERGGEVVAARLSTEVGVTVTATGDGEGVDWWRHIRRR
jgi:hypothetical protein